jgi:UDP-GlcNAc:undecaprenyl-phosphate GlcNAc-1-phosphate transferase
MDISIWWFGARALVFSLVLTPICRDVFRSFRVVDAPDAGRKLHRRPIPRVGGIAIALSYVLAYVFSENRDQILFSGDSLVWKLLPAAVIVFAVGLVDDLLGLKPWQKLLGQSVASVMAYSAGVRILGGAGYTVGPAWSLVLTVFWLLLCSNAINLVDGMDGLAVGVGLFAAMTIFLSSLMGGNQPLSLATFPLAMCLLGFLCYNFNPATIFLGDSGSLLIGFLLGCYGIIWTQKSTTLLGMLAPMMVLAVPLLDVSLCVVRRFLRRQPIFSADRGHIHHRLLERGLAPRQAVLLLYAGCGLAAMFSLLHHLVRSMPLSLLLVALFATATWLGIQYLNYTEFDLARRLILGGEIQEILSRRLAVERMSRTLATLTTGRECWTEIAKTSREFGFSSVRLRLLGEQFEDQFVPAAPAVEWRIEVPLPGGDSIVLTRGFDSSGNLPVISAFVEALRGSLAAKIAATAAAGAGSPGS